MGTFFTKEIGISCPFARTPSGEILTKEWTFGVESNPALALVPPRFADESAGARAVSLADDVLNQLEFAPGLISACAGEPAVSRWLNLLAQLTAKLSGPRNHRTMFLIGP